MISIILAGGEGRRLLPFSNAENPKQFIEFAHLGGSLFQQTYKRALKLCNQKDIYVVTNEKYTNKVLDDLAAIGVDGISSNIIGEPMPKNTLPAIMAGVMKANQDDIAVVFPADHLISSEDLFVKIILESRDLAGERIVTFGIQPGHPETGYGYIEPGKPMSNGFEVRTFREKPDENHAIEYINKGFLWNSGIFLFRTGLFLDEVRKRVPDIHGAFSAGGDINGIFSKIEKGVSIDIGLLEKSENVAVVPMEIGWDDLGSFKSLFNAFPKIPLIAAEGDKFIEVDELYRLVIRKSGNVLLEHENITVLLSLKSKV